MFVSLRLLAKQREKNPRRRSLRIAILACLLFVGPAAAPPRVTVCGSTPQNTASSDSLLLSSQKRREEPVLPVLDSAEAWKHLPTAEKGYGRALPIWARTLAKTLPHTTAAMLELDYLHRTKNPLEPRLRAQLRWVAARANHCRYSEESAVADLHRIGMDEAGIRQLAGDWTALSPEMRAALQFGHKLSCDGSSVTDAEVTQLIAWYGERQVVAMTMLVAYASFLDRILLALGLTEESGGTLLPLEARFLRLPLGTSRAAPPRREPSSSPASKRTETMGKRKSLAKDTRGLEEILAEQRTRHCRIALPGANSEAPRWGIVCRIYQPELADAWANCAHAFSDEANQDPLFEHSVFWIITHDLGCFY